MRKPKCTCYNVFINGDVVEQTCDVCKAERATDEIPYCEEPKKFTPEDAARTLKELGFEEIK